jgi:hypothetical protein
MHRGSIRPFDHKPHPTEPTDASWIHGTFAGRVASSCSVLGDVLERTTHSHPVVKCDAATTRAAIALRRCIR